MTTAENTSSQPVTISDDPLEAHNKGMMEDILDNYLSEFEEEGVNFTESVRGFYGNEMDDLHDAAGDADYQRGNLERMLFIEKFLGAFLDVVFTLDQKRKEAKWL